MRTLLGLLIALGTGMTAGAELHVEAVNVGYGECYVLQDVQSGKVRWAGLVDAGTADGAPAVLETLRRSGIQQLNDVFLSHGHPNHTGALLALLEQFPIERLYWRGWANTEEPMSSLLGPLKRHGAAVHTALSKGKPLRRGRVMIEILNPARPLEHPHEGGLVLLLTYGKTAFLFSGDASPALQERLWPVVQERLRGRGITLEAITWPHHGNILAPSWEKGMADVSWIFVGVGPNPHGLPRETNYPDLLGRALRTDKNGNQRLISDGKKTLLQ